MTAVQRVSICPVFHFHARTATKEMAGTPIPKRRDGQSDRHLALISPTPQTGAEHQRPRHGRAAAQVLFECVFAPSHCAPNSLPPAH